MGSEVVIKIDDIKKSIGHKIKQLSEDPLTEYAACIYRVSQKLRKANEAAYTPRLVSIGPLHHGLSELQGMEFYKARFLKNFLGRFGIGLDTLITPIAEGESFLRGCYEGTFSHSGEQFTEMILLDGIFIIELFLENHFPQLRNKNEIIFDNQWMYNDLLNDMLLLENQLPLRLIEELLDLVEFSFLVDVIGIKPTIYELAQEFFKNVGNTGKKPLTESCHKARHFVEFLLILNTPGEKEKEAKRKKEEEEEKKEKEKEKEKGKGKRKGKTKRNCFCKEKLTSRSKKFEHTRSATELRQAGVQFRCGDGNCFFKVEFDEAGGMLTVPKLTVNDTTETFFRNLIAFEQCGYSGYYSEDITSYVILMDGFINTPDDVKLLVNHEIIENELGENELVADLFNSLYKEVVTEANIFYFEKLCGKLKKYSRNQIHKCRARCSIWWVMFDRKYFSSPWTFCSLLAAIVLLLLTITQTVVSILQL